MASNVCLKLQSLTLGNKMSFGHLKPISDYIKLLPKTHKRLIVTVSSNKCIPHPASKSQTNSTSFLKHTAATKFNNDLVCLNIDLEGGTKRFIKTWSSLLVQGSIIISTSQTLSKAICSYL